MRIFLICIILLFTCSCKAQNDQRLESKITSLYKVNEKDIQNCKKESEELRKKKTEEWLIENIYDQCTAPLEYLNFFRNNTLKMLEKTSNDKDFLIINYISSNITIPFDTKTILYANNNYFGIKHYFKSENDKIIEKNEEFEVSQFEIDIIEKIDQYLRTGKSEDFSNKSNGLIGLYINWNIVARISGKDRMIKLYKIK